MVAREPYDGVFKDKRGDRRDTLQRRLLLYVFWCEPPIQKRYQIMGLFPLFRSEGNVHTHKTPCDLLVDGKHPASAQRFSGKNQQHYSHTLNQLYSMPEQLTDDIAAAAAKLVLLE